MRFITAVILSMPEKNQQTFNGLIRAWNAANSSSPGFKRLDPLQDKDRRVITFDGEALTEMKSHPSIRKSLEIFRRAYNTAESQMEQPKARVKPESSRSKKSTTTTPSVSESSTED